jgi:predicted glycoside hydrolase/deacetylase ChbG (UPF0249 family)
MHPDKSKNFIISADDFGVSKEANAAILNLAKIGKLDRVAVMMGGIISQEEIKALLDSGVKIDIHLHLFESEFFLKRKKERDDGTVKRVSLFVISYLSGQYGTKRMREIWQKQIEEFRKTFGQYPDGINSHEHIHFFPPFFKIVCELLKKLSIPYYRLGKKGTSFDFVSASFILNILRKINLKRIKKSGLVSSPSLITSEFLISFDWLKNFPLSDISKSGNIEIVFHPERDEEYEFIVKNL